MPSCFLRAAIFALVTACASLAQAQQAQPGLFESLKPKEAAPVREATTSAAPDASRNLAVGDSGRRVALVIGNAAYPGSN